MQVAQVVLVAVVRVEMKQHLTAQMEQQILAAVAVAEITTAAAKAVMVDLE
jgi:hypothetical protein